MKAVLAAFVLALALWAAPVAVRASAPVYTYGVDVSTLVSTAQWTCMANSNPVIQHAIVRGFRSTGSSDPNVVQSLKNAIAAGYDKSNLGVYIFPRPLSSAGVIQDGGVQVRNMMNNLIKGGAGDTFTQLWLDIEGGDLYWSRITANNIKFVEQMIEAAKEYSPKYALGIYTSKSQWAPIVGSTYTGGKDFPLWYAAYNGKTDFNDFEPFAGWTAPTLHQYAGDKKVCGVPADLNVQLFGTLFSRASEARINGGGGPALAPITNSAKCAAQRGVCTNVAKTPCVGNVKKGLCDGPSSIVCCVTAPVLRSTPGAVAERPATSARITAEAVDTGKVTWQRDRPRRHAARKMAMGGLMKIRRHRKGKKKADK